MVSNKSGHLSSTREVRVGLLGSWDSQPDEVVALGHNGPPMDPRGCFAIVPDQIPSVCSPFVLGQLCFFFVFVSGQGTQCGTQCALSWHICGTQKGGAMTAQTRSGSELDLQR